MKILYSEIATKQIQKIYKFDIKSAKNILNKIENYAQNPLGNHDVKKLKGDMGEFFRLRAGNYRVIFDNNLNVMYIYEIKHRKDAYND